MAISKYQIKAKGILQLRAFELYRTGLSLRQVALAVGKSHEWVRVAVDKYEKQSQTPMDIGV